MFSHCSATPKERRGKLTIVGVKRSLGGGRPLRMGGEKTQPERSYSSKSETQDTVKGPLNQNRVKRRLNPRFVDRMPLQGGFVLLSERKNDTKPVGGWWCRTRDGGPPGWKQFAARLTDVPRTAWGTLSEEENEIFFRKCTNGVEANMQDTLWETGGRKSQSKNIYLFVAFFLTGKCFQARRALA